MKEQIKRIEFSVEKWKWCDNPTLNPTIALDLWLAQTVCMKWLGSFTPLCLPTKRVCRQFVIYRFPSTLSSVHIKTVTGARGFLSFITVNTKPFSCCYYSRVDIKRSTLIHNFSVNPNFHLLSYSDAKLDTEVNIDIRDQEDEERKKKKIKIKRKQIKKNPSIPRTIWLFVNKPFRKKKK